MFVLLYTHLVIRVLMFQELSLKCVVCIGYLCRIAFMFLGNMQFNNYCHYFKY